MTYHVLVVDDSELQAKAIKLSIEKMLKYNVSSVYSGKEACEILLSSKGDNIDLVILDLSMPEIDGMEVLEKVCPNRPELPIIINTAYGDVQKAVEAVKKGAIDFIEKQDGPERMKVSIENVRKIATLNKQVQKLYNFSQNIYGFEDIIGRSRSIKKVISTAQKGANSNIPILLQGESGVGKELFARAIHSASDKKNGPFIAVNCSAIPENLVESVLFGHEKGSFTGAMEKSIGKFREADGGTIFLDEIGELPLEVQSKLLRVLQNFEVESVGGNKPYNVDIRVVSATNKDLEKAVEEGSFREDLYYRINVLTLKIPALRERKEDIPLLIEYLTEKICSKEDVSIKDLTIPLLEALQEYWWPGNVRQLENAIYRAVVLSQNTVLDFDDFENILKAIEKSNPQLAETRREASKTEIERVDFFNKVDGKFKSISEYEKDIIQRALDFYNWNISKVSKVLEIGRSTLYRKMKDYDIEEKPTVEEIADFRKKVN